MIGLSMLLMTTGMGATTIADNGEKLLQRADSLYRMGNFEKAVEVYLQSAETGNAEAQFDIGYAYYTGEGTQRDYTSAAMWFKRSAKQNFAKAQYNLAYCYMNGRGVPRDYDKAFNLLLESAGNNYKRAQLTLADCYARGVLVEQNEAEYNKWKNKAEGKETAEPTQKAAATSEPKATAAKPAATIASEPVAATKPAASKPAAPKPQKETLSGDFDIEVNIPGEQPKEQVQEQPKAQAQEQAQEQPANNPQQSNSPNVILGPNELKKASAAIPKANAQAKDTEAPTNASAKPTETKADAQANPTAAPANSPAAQAPTAAVAKAPTLRILYPEDQSMFHTDQVKLKYQLINNGCPDSTRIVVMVDGQRQPATRAVRAANTIDVDLPRHDCTIMMYAQNSCGNSEPVSLRLIRETSQFELPKLFVVAIGVGDYNDPKLPKLKLTCKDAQDFAKVIATKKGLPYEDVQVKLLCDGEATRADIFEAMEWLKQESSPNDVCVFFYAGHGLRDEKDRFYFIPYGCSSDKLYDCFSASDFRNEAEDINGKFIAFVDACYSGALFEGTRSAATSHFVEQLKRSKNGMLLYASSSSDTKSREDESWGNGAFTKALVESFNGAAREEHDEGLSTQELELFLYKEVRKITDYKQTPIFINPNGIEHFNIFNYEK